MQIVAVSGTAAGSVQIVAVSGTAGNETDDEDDADMSIEVISIGSSSSGNSYIVRAGDVNILLDVGLSAKKIMQALELYGVEPEDVDAVLITHEHVDHVRSVRAIGRRCCNAVFIASRGTVECTENFKYIPEERLRIVEAGDELEFGPGAADMLTAGRICSGTVRIRAFGLSHDAAEPLSYSVRCGSDKLAVVTDTGIITDEIYEEIRDASMLVFEANHDEDLLMFGEYPYPVKVRIKSDHGHLSNRYAGEQLTRLLKYRERLSADCNDASEDCHADVRHEGHCDASEDLFPNAGTEDQGGMQQSGASAEHDRPLALMLAHLSYHNNAPFYARTTIESILEEGGFRRGVHYTLTIASKDELTELR